MILEDFLRSHAELQGNKVAIARGDEAITYASLYKRAKAKAGELSAECSANNLPAREMPIIVHAHCTIDFLISYFAAHIACRPFVPVEKDISDERLFEIKNLLGITDIPTDVADILMTSGTTGTAKGSMLSHGSLVANGDNLIDALGFSQDLAFIVSGSLAHIGSLSKVWPTIMVGGTIVLTDGIKDIEAFFSALDYPSQKIATFLVPTSIRIILRLASERLASYADKIDFIETGAAPMVLADMQHLCSVLPHSRLYNTYASTETGVVATHNYNTPGGQIPGCLGRPMKHSSITIRNNGRIYCSGKTIMRGYLDFPIVYNPKMSFPTFDIGYIDNQGRLFLEGRIDDIINVGGFKVSPFEVENAAMLFPAIADCICISAPHPILGNILKLIYVAKPSLKVEISKLVSHLRNHLESYKLPLAYEQADKIARNANGKLDRKSYR